MDFVDKKEAFADVVEQFIAGEVDKETLDSKISEYATDSDFIGKPLFENIFKELSFSSEELSRRELKQRVLMIRSYID